jgi:hypothetical protein
MRRRHQALQALQQLLWHTAYLSYPHQYRNTRVMERVACVAGTDSNMCMPERFAPAVTQPCLMHRKALVAYQ